MPVVVELFAKEVAVERDNTITPADRVDEPWTKLMVSVAHDM